MYILHNFSENELDFWKISATTLAARSNPIHGCIPQNDHRGDPISLMADQSFNLAAKGIHTTFLGSAQKDLLAVDQVYQGECNVVYATLSDSKRLFNTGGDLQYPFAKLIKERKIGLVATDEETSNIPSLNLQRREKLG